MRKRALAWLRSIVDELVLTAGLAGIAYGAWPWMGRGALLLPSIVLVWIALPERRPFVERAKPPIKVRRTQKIVLPSREDE